MSDFKDIKKIVEREFIWRDELSLVENVEKMVSNFEEDIEYYRWRQCYHDDY